MSQELLVRGREVLDSRGNPTLEVTLQYGDVMASAKVPSGKSAGAREALELRDADGRGVSQAIFNVNTTIADCIRNMPVDPLLIDQALIDLDGTQNKSRLGANALLGVSLALRRLKAKIDGVPLWQYIATESHSTVGFPRLYMNVMNGGAHADFALPFQEYIYVVEGIPSIAYAKAQDLYQQLGILVQNNYGEVPIGDEGGYSPKITDIKIPFAHMQELIERDPSVRIAIDAAASEFFNDGVYHVCGRNYSEEELINCYQELVNQYQLISIEDPLDEFSSEGFTHITQALLGKSYVVGDDFTVTNPQIVETAVAQKGANAIIIKPNQIGTLKEVYRAVELSRAAGWKIIVSHRSGETDDDFIADLAVGLGVFGLKAGAPSQLVRRAKYERLLAIEKEI